MAPAERPRPARTGASSRSRRRPRLTGGATGGPVSMGTAAPGGPSGGHRRRPIDARPRPWPRPPFPAGGRRSPRLPLCAQPVPLGAAGRARYQAPGTASASAYFPRSILATDTPQPPAVNDPRAHKTQRTLVRYSRFFARVPSYELCLSYGLVSSDFSLCRSGREALAHFKSSCQERAQTGTNFPFSPNCHCLV